MNSPAYASVVLDVDSTLCGVEGIDWLAQRRDRELAEEIAALTRRAMAGELPIEAVYAERLDRIRPTASEVAALALTYRARLAPGAEPAIARLRGAGVTLHLVSGGLLPAILPVAAELGFQPSAVHAVGLRFDAGGRYAGFDRDSPLICQDGKAQVVAALGLPRPILAVGDGATDLAIRRVADGFAAFTGFARRGPVVNLADCEVPDFERLVELVLP